MEYRFFPLFPFLIKRCLIAAKCRKQTRTKIKQLKTMTAVNLKTLLVLAN